MLRRILLAALAAGALVGVLISAIHAVTTTPLILQAESFEQHADASGGTSAHMPEGELNSTLWPPIGDVERLLYSVLVNVIIAIGFALLLSGAFALHGQPMDGRRGVLWGLAGFAVFTLAPTLGLPPEIPGSLAADLSARQVWWLAAAGTAATGLWLLVFGKNMPLRLLGILIAILPHAWGAPHPEEIGGAVPAELAARFAAASIVVGAIFWSLLGWFTGTIYKRLG